MEAVPATSGVRRTVRVAAALVAGQVLLVAVIGWVTLTCADKRPARDASPVDQMAAPPALIPPAPPSGSSSAPSSSPTASPDISPSGRPATRRPAHTAEPGRATRPASPPASPAADPSTVATAPASVLPSVVPSPSTSSGPLTLMPSSFSPAVTPSPSPTAPAKRAPVRAGQPCYHIFELARADDGWLVRCLPTRYRQLRWKIV